MEPFVILFLRKSNNRLGFCTISGAKNREEALRLFHKSFEPEGEDYEPVMIAEKPEDMRR